MKDAFGVEREEVSKVSAGLKALSPERLRSMKGLGGDWARNKMAAHQAGKAAVGERIATRGAKSPAGTARFTAAGNRGQALRQSTDYVERNAWGKGKAGSSRVQDALVDRGMKWPALSGGANPARVRGTAGPNTMRFAQNQSGYGATSTITPARRAAAFARKSGGTRPLRRPA